LLITLLRLLSILSKIHSGKL